MKRIITISREFGSGGRTIGKEVAKRLGVPCYDRELIEKIVDETGYNKKFIEEKTVDLIVQAAGGAADHE